MSTHDSSPLRAELLSAGRLADEARGIAATQRWTTAEPPATTPLIALTKRAAEALALDNAELARSARSGFAASPAGEWLLDNYYLLEEQVLLIGEDLPAHYGVELPRLTAGAWAGFPRLYEALLTLVAHTDSRFDEDLLVRFVDGYQDVNALTIGEVWAVPIMLRIALVENVSRLSRAVVGSHRAEGSAESWGERLVLAVQDEPDRVPALLGELETDPAARGSAFHLRLAQRLTALETGGESVNAWLERRLAHEGITLHDAQVELQQGRRRTKCRWPTRSRASGSWTVSNGASSSRPRAWSNTSSVRTLRGATGRMDFVSRDRYRHAIEGVAHRCDHTEIEVAEAAVSHCLGHSGSTRPTRYAATSGITW